MCGRISLHLGLLMVSSTPLLWAQAPASPLLVLPEARGHRMVLIDPTAKKVIGQVVVPGWPHEVAFSRDGKTAYLPSYSDAIVGAPGINGQTLDVVDMNTRMVTGTWDLGKQLRPHMPMLGADDTLFVSTELAQAISIVDLKDGKITGEIPTGAKESHVFVRTSDGRKIYTANLHAGSISVIDAKARKLIKLIQISGLVNRIALSMDGKRLFVTDGDSPNVIVIDTATDEILRKAAVSAPAFSVFPTPDGKWLLVGEDLGTKGKLEVLDLENLAAVHIFDVDRLPFGIRVVGSEAFVACYLSGNLDVLNLADWTMEPPISSVAHGDGLAVWNGAR
jgi:YVTN family beta-propeller protein